MHQSILSNKTYIFGLHLFFNYIILHLFYFSFFRLLATSETVDSNERPSSDQATSLHPLVDCQNKASHNYINRSFSKFLILFLVMIILFRKETFYLEFPILMMLSSKASFVSLTVTCILCIQKH